MPVFFMASSTPETGIESAFVRWLKKMVWWHLHFRRQGPSNYLPAIQFHQHVGLSDARMDQILHSHCIDAATMRADDFDAFFGGRQESLLAMIERAMGQSIERSAGEGLAQAESEAFDEADAG